MESSPTVVTSLKATFATSPWTNDAYRVWDRGWWHLFLGVGAGENLGISFLTLLSPSSSGSWHRNHFK